MHQKFPLNPPISESMKNKNHFRGKFLFLRSCRDKSSVSRFGTNAASGDLNTTTNPNRLESHNFKRISLFRCDFCSEFSFLGMDAFINRRGVVSVLVGPRQTYAQISNPHTTCHLFHRRLSASRAYRPRRFRVCYRRETDCHLGNVIGRASAYGANVWTERMDRAIFVDFRDRVATWGVVFFIFM